MERNTDPNISNSANKSTQGLADIRDICAESIYDYACDKAKQFIALKEKFNFKQKPDMSLETRPIRTFVDGTKYLGQFNPQTGKKEGQGITVWGDDGAIYEGYYR